MQPRRHIRSCHEAARPPCTSPQVRWSCLTWRNHDGHLVSCGDFPLHMARHMRMRSTLATEVPPNFITRRDIGNQTEEKKGNAGYGSFWHGCDTRLWPKAGVYVTGPAPVSRRLHWIGQGSVAGGKNGASLHPPRGLKGGVRLSLAARNALELFRSIFIGSERVRRRLKSHSERITCHNNNPPCLRERKSGGR